MNAATARGALGVSRLLPLESPVIVDTLAFESPVREWSGDLLPHQLVGNVAGHAVMYASDSKPQSVYIVRLVSADRFDTPRGGFVSHLLVDESAILRDVREVSE